MNKNILEYILNEIQKKYTLEKGIDVETFDYVENGYVDSLGIIQFMINLENEFNIEFSDDEISDPKFRVIGDLARLIERKIKENEES